MGAAIYVETTKQFGRATILDNPGDATSLNIMRYCCKQLESELSDGGHSNDVPVVASTPTVSLPWSGLNAPRKMQHALGRLARMPSINRHGGASSSKRGGKKRHTSNALAKDSNGKPKTT